MSTQLAPLDPMFALLCAFLVGCLICLIAEVVISAFVILVDDCSSCGVMSQKASIVSSGPG